MSTEAIDGESRTRREYINGLRAFANLLENNSDLPMPTHGDTVQWLLFNQGDESQKAVAAQVIRAVPGEWRKRDTSDLFRATATLCGLNLEIVVNREVVCAKKVVGTKTSTKQVPVAYESVTVTEDVVEWDCGSLLSPKLPGRTPAAVSA